MILSCSVWAKNQALQINELEYFETNGLNVMVFDDYYPDGHQGGISIIHHGVRTATNGDLRLSTDPGQWQPIPKKGIREVSHEDNEIRVKMSFPNEKKHMQGFNPLIYPELDLQYTVSVSGIESGIVIQVDLEKPLPEEWVGKVGFNFELFPTLIFGKSFLMDNQTGIFPQQANGPFHKDSDGILQIDPMAKGHKLVIAPESSLQRMTIESSDELQLIDGRGNHNNGWFVVRSTIASGATKGAVQWKITTHLEPEWKQEPVIQLSQVGYHPNQEKIAYIELDKKTPILGEAKLLHFSDKGEWETVLESTLEDWGNFLRYRYGLLNFSNIKKPGLYRIQYGAYQSHAFQISEDIYTRHVWQPTMEYFLPVQMCHMRINEKYRVWHDTCHLDDALMAPVSINHFDGYRQGEHTLCDFKPLEPVPGLNIGGWHDAGDYDLRVESQIGTVHTLALAYEHFSPDLDVTLIDQENRWVEIHQPDEKNDFLQQIEHGLLTVLGGYDALGRLYRGIITPTLRQYVMLGDAVSMSDGKVYESAGDEKNADGVWYQKVANKQSKYFDPHRAESAYEYICDDLDDRLVFTEDNPTRSLRVAAGLASASRVMKVYRPDMSKRSLEVAQELWDIYSNSDKAENFDKESKKLWYSKVLAASELALTTQDSKYLDYLVENTESVVSNFAMSGYSLGRIMPLFNDETFTNAIYKAAVALKEQTILQQNKTPYGVPYEPKIWGDGWIIQRFGIAQYFLHKSWPDLFPAENLYKALNFILGCHPGTNNASFASGVGSKSVLTAYGVNRADWAYIPGGVVSGTALIRPDFPELLEWPYLWQQTEYVMGGGATNFMFMVMAAEQLLNP